MTERNRGDRAAIVAGLGLTIESAFVPFSQSRNRAEKSPSLNWRVTLMHNGSAVFSTDYSAGCAHCFSYKQSGFGPRTIEHRETDLKVAWECETGGRALGVTYAGRNVDVYGTGYAKGQKFAQPDALNVIASLSMDSDVIDAGGFEEWASSYGYDIDSRSAEKIYAACLETALKLRAAIGDSGLQALREAFEGY